MTDLEFSRRPVNGLEMFWAEQGTGPLVILCHGFPETLFSWQHQLPALAGAGYRSLESPLDSNNRTGRPFPILWEPAGS